MGLFYNPFLRHKACYYLRQAACYCFFSIKRGHDLLSIRTLPRWILSEKNSLTEQPARPEEAQAQAQAQEEAQAQLDAQAEAQEEWDPDPRDDPPE